MTATTDRTAAGGAPPERPARPLPGGRRAAAAVVTAQAVVYGGLATRGWFYQDDIDYTAQAAGRPLGLDYLLEPNNDHLTPGLRLAYWLLAHLAPYSYGPTVVLRVLLQAVATALLARLLVRLLGWRPLVLAGLGLYAFTLLTLPSFLSLSSAVNLLPAHVAALVLLDRHVRFQLTGRLRHATVGAAALLAGLLFWEKITLVGLLLPVLSLVVLTEGGPRERLAATVARWRGWLVYLAPVAGFFGYYTAAGYGGTGAWPGLGAVAALGGVSWWRAVAPALVGGPWSWFAGADSYVSVADPPLAGAVLAQVAVAGLLVVAVRRNGPRAAAVWAMPALYLAGNAVVLGTGRYDQFGTLTGRIYHYLSDLTIPLVLAVVLSLALPRPAEVRDRCGRVRDLLDDWSGPRPDLPGPARRTRVLAAGLVAAYVASFALSAAGFDRRWSANPSRGWLESTVAELRAAPGAPVWDTAVSGRVLTVLSSSRRLSQVLAPLDLDVAYDDRSRPGEPRVVDDDGRLVDSVFVASAQSRERPDQWCSHYLDRAGTLVVPLDRPLPPGDHFFKIDYILQRGSPVTVRLGAGGRLVDPVHGSTVELRAGLHGVAVQSTGVPVDRVEVSSSNAALRLCVTHVTAGYPFPARR